MGHHALQRVVVRMIYDPVFARSVSADARRALKDVSLSEAEVSWLKDVDPRAFATDVHRVDRTLKAMIDEYPRSTAIIFRRDTNLQGLAAFFSEREFHEAIQNRLSLAISFGDYLMRYAGRLERDLRSMADLEQNLAALQRNKTPEFFGKAEYCLHPCVSLHQAPKGTLELFVELGNRLSRVNTDLANAALSGTVKIEDLEPLEDRRFEFILAVKDFASGGVSLERCSETLYGLLVMAQGGSSREDLIDVVLREGGTRKEAAEIIKGFLDEGLLFRVIKKSKNTPEPKRRT